MKSAKNYAKCRNGEIKVLREKQNAVRGKWNVLRAVGNVVTVVENVVRVEGDTDLFEDAANLCGNL